VPFTSYGFLLFFALVMALRWLLPARAARWVLLFASAAFYLSWGARLAVLLAALTGFTYGAGALLQRAGAGAGDDAKRATRKKAILAAAIVVLLGTLGTFKYAAYFASFVPGLTAPHLPLPLGISFYVFEMISYVVDVYRGTPGARSPTEFALYISYFPHLIAGPIVRASELLPQLREPAAFDADRAAEGMFIFLTGFVKKMVLADNLAVFADLVFKKPGDHDGLSILVGVLAYTGQIFCDFSGYTDIARGGSKMLGLDLPENFDYPYLSESITEFWRRWHITLSRWLRDYLYIPLGGNRGSKLATYRNLLVTMTLGGLWHGARTTFVVWGAYHGVLLAAHKLLVTRTKNDARWQRARAHGAYRAVALTGTLALVMVGWVFFRATTFHDAAVILRRVASPSAWPALATFRPTKPFAQAVWYLGATTLLHVAGAARLGVRTHRALPAAARGLVWAGAAIVCYVFATTSPTFIYFYF
jgi:alginate O-acetyltransferase complex protein AlgI